MIRSFDDKETERIWSGLRSLKLPFDIQNRALDKLRMLNRAQTLDDLRNPPGNRLHDLKDDRAGQHPFPLICSGAYVSSGMTGMRTMSKSSTTTEAG